MPAAESAANTAKTDAAAPAVPPAKLAPTSFIAVAVF
jgi:hypothetical protein